MEKSFKDLERCAKTAFKILEQIHAGVGNSAMLSWGIVDIIPTFFKEMETLQIHVNGRLFSGVVSVCYNVLHNWYIVYLGSDELCVADCYNIGDVIDRAVEVGNDWDEYQEFCKSQVSELGAFKNVTNVIVF